MNVKEELLDYINCEENNGAILLTGNWGCGKTYLIKQMISEKDYDFAFITVSLFGIDTIEALNRKVKEKLLFAQIGVFKNEKSRKKASVAVKSISNLGELTKVSKGFKAVFSTDVYDFVDIKKEIPCVKDKQLRIQKVVLIFDDFERCNIPIIDLLGAINEYTESCEIKTIIVADEKHINEGKYKEFKEKLISRSIKLSSDYSTIIKEIINGYNESEEGYLNFLKNNTEEIIRLFEESKCENLRVLKYILIDFERIFCAWKKTNVSEKDFLRIFLSNGVIYLEHKIGGYPNTEDKGRKFINNAEKKYLKYEEDMTFFTIESWIKEYKWDENEFIEEIKKKFYVKDLTIDQRFLNTSFWYLEQEIIDKGLPIALKKSYEGDLSVNDLVRLLGKISGLKLNGMNITEKIDYDKMIEGVNIREKKIKNGELKEQRCLEFIPAENLDALEDEKAKQLYLRLDNMDERVGAIERYKEFYSYVKNPNISSSRNLDYGSIYCFDDELLELFYNSFIKQPNGIKREMCSVLCRINFDYKYSSTKQEIEKSKENLRELVKKLNIEAKNAENELNRCVYVLTAKSIEEKQNL